MVLLSPSSEIWQGGGQSMKAVVLLALLAGMTAFLTVFVGLPNFGLCSGPLGSNVGAMLCKGGAAEGTTHLKMGALGSKADTQGAKSTRSRTATGGMADKDDVKLQEPAVDLDEAACLGQTKGATITATEAAVAELRQIHSITHKHQEEISALREDMKEMKRLVAAMEKNTQQQVLMSVLNVLSSTSEHFRLEWGSWTRWYGYIDTNGGANHLQFHGSARIKNLLQPMSGVSPDYAESKISYYKLAREILETFLIGQGYNISARYTSRGNYDPDDYLLPCDPEEARDRIDLMIHELTGRKPIWKKEADGGWTIWQGEA